MTPDPDQVFDLIEDIVRGVGHEPAAVIHLAARLANHTWQAGDMGFVPGDLAYLLAAAGEATGALRSSSSTSTRIYTCAAMP